MKNAPFTNDSLVVPVIEFVGVVDARMAALQAQLAALPLPNRDDAFKNMLPEALVEGACADLMREIQRLGESTTIEHRALSPDLMAEFTYLLAAWVDETLIRTFRERLPRRYSGAVEHLLFGTMDAGEQIFTRIDRMIARRSHNDAGLAAAYLLILSLGFRGQYPERGEAEALARYHRELSQIALDYSSQSIRAERAIEMDTSAYHQSRTLPRRQTVLLWALTVALWIIVMVGMDITIGQLTKPIQRLLHELTPVQSIIKMNQPNALNGEMGANNASITDSVNGISGVNGVSRVNENNKMNESGVRP